MLDRMSYDSKASVFPSEGEPVRSEACPRDEALSLAPVTRAADSCLPIHACAAPARPSNQMKMLPEGVAAHRANMVHSRHTLRRLPVVAVTVNSRMEMVYGLGAKVIARPYLKPFWLCPTINHERVTANGLST